PDRSILHFPKQAPSVWQIFFTDWLQSQRLEGGVDKKLNIVEEAKAAGRAYHKLSDQDRADLGARAKVLKENYERELAIWKRTLTPADVERENAFRTAQRKSGKSRQKNINDPNAPKRPLSPYFLYLQAMRADQQMAKQVFGGVTAPIQQSVLAAEKWRSMGEAEKRPYLEQAKNAKIMYEAERKIYENTESLNKGPPTSFFIYPG
ncbi:high mobility group box domain-containing protein, partial [Hysterangium stoloniferum]